MQGEHDVDYVVFTTCPTAEYSYTPLQLLYYYMDGRSPYSVITVVGFCTPAAAVDVCYCRFFFFSPFTTIIKNRTPRFPNELLNHPLAR